MTTAYADARPSTGNAVDLSNSRELRHTLAHIPTPLIIAAAEVDGAPVGMVIGSFVGQSVEPALVSVSIQKTSTSWPVLRRATAIGISVLSDANYKDVPNFYRPSAQRFDGLDWEQDGSAILIPDAAVHLTTSLQDEFEIGDHILAVARIDRAIQHAEVDTSLSPLVFHRRALATPKHL